MVATSDDDLELEKRRSSLLRLDGFPFPNSGQPVARLLVEPSFTPDWVVSVYHPKSNICQVFATLAHENVFYANQHEVKRMIVMRPRPASIATTDHLAEIPCELADQLGATWQALLTDVIPPGPDDPLVMDGTMYFAVSFVRRIGYSCGQAHSPPEGSPAHKLTRLGVALLDYSRADESSRPGMAAAIRSLASEVKSIADNRDVAP